MVKKYAIFDLDDTLLDFTRGEVENITQLLHQYGVQDVQRGLATYTQVNLQVWGQIEQGAERAPLLEQRFTQTFARLGVVVDGATIAAQYSQLLDHNYYTLAGAAPFLRRLKQAGVHLIVGTNGVKTTQLHRLAGSGLTPYFDQVVISDDVGYAKPDERFFQPIFDQHPALNKANTLMIGDRLQSDVLGALHANLDNVWFNPRHQLNHEAYRPTYEVDGFAPLQKLLLA